MSTFNETLTDGVISGELTPVTFDDGGLTDSPIMGEFPGPVGLSTITGDGVVMSPVFRLAEAVPAFDGFVIQDVRPVVAFRAGAAIADIVKIRDSLAPSSKYGIVVVNQFKLQQLLALGIPRAILDSFTVHDSNRIAIALAVIQKLTLKDVSAPIATYGLALIQALALHDSFANFFGGELADTLSMMQTFTVQFQAVAGLVQDMTLADVLGQSLIFSLSSTEDLEVSDSNLLNMIYAGDPLLDTVCLSAAYVDPGGDVTTWAINTRTGAVTEYQNFNFNSIAKMGNQYLAANATGLYTLDGPTDAGLNIPTRVKSGWMQPSGSKFTSFKAAYLGLRVRDNAREFFLKLHAGDGRTYVYAVVPRNMATTKINMGKGLRSRYFSFELETTGTDYDLDSIEFVPLSSYRRV